MLQILISLLGVALSPSLASLLRLQIPSSGWSRLCPEEQTEPLKCLPVPSPHLYLSDARFEPPRVPLARTGLSNILDSGTLPAPGSGSEAREFTFRFHSPFHQELLSRVPPELGFQEGGASGCGE